MRVLIFTVYDAATKAYLQPFSTRSKGEAVRSFIEACNDEKLQFKKHASDYTMFALGEFDDNSGIYTTHEPERVISAVECIRDDIFPPEKQIQ